MEDPLIWTVLPLRHIPQQLGWRKTVAVLFGRRVETSDHVVHTLSTRFAQNHAAEG